MFRFKLLFVCVLFVCLAGAAFAQSLADADMVSIPLVVDKGFPLQVLLTEKLRFKESETVHAKLLEPVYSFDREVIPSGTAIEGTITGFQKGGTWKRVSAMLSGNFTPVRDPQIAFHTLVLADGTRIPIETSVVPGTEKVVRADKQPAGEIKNSLVSTIKKPGKEQLKTWLWGMSPYQPQYLPAGTRLSAVLETPLDFGEAVFQKSVLDAIGSEPPPNSIVSIRLITPLDSRTTRPGAAVDALLTRPVFSEEQKLIFPVGARLHGQVTVASGARSFHRNGQLAFNFTTIAPPISSMSSVLQSQDVDASLVSIQVTHQMKDLRIKEGNTTRIVESKKRFIAPAWSFIKAERSIYASEDSFGTALLGAYRGKFLKQIAGGGESGFGLPGSITGAMVPPVGIGLGFFGAARSAYSSFLGRGRDIVLPETTTMEVRLATRPENQ
jgi:hypothetical protein